MEKIGILVENLTFFGPKRTFFQKIFETSRDFHKSEEKLKKIAPFPSLPTKIYILALVFLVQTYSTGSNLHFGPSSLPPP
jgi:hypothetical protein